eukprot:CAMPEP_0198272300 /NCGR_PEP_ID=MMETSP1447-20131203/52647_1 /TAXON_ID=420782 /ORGANISM="Chaetoceros dichaeta, Strain CCMP1751" /LENGTH=175 /DNA_ID=CAMNT_0043965399 /DNA_START=173 /DNA_END=700 /DNA_ORIENTATION=+
MNGSLGRWISRQRTLYRSQKLKSDRYHKLAQLGFAFEDASALEFRSKLDGQWEVMYRDLHAHRERMGHCFDVPETESLGKWLYRQRWLYRHGNLREDRARKLLALGFDDKKVLKRDLLLDNLLSPPSSSSFTAGGGGDSISRKRRRTMNSVVVATTAATATAIVPATITSTTKNS